MEQGSIPRVPLQVSRNCVVASIQVDLSDEVLQQFQSDLLSLIWSSGVSTVILDASGIEIMDGEDFNSLVHAMKMTSLMGARPIIAGLRPGVVASLIELDLDVGQIEAALNLDHAFRLVEVQSMDAHEAEVEVDESSEIEEGVDREGDGEDGSDENQCDIGA
jgi:rsbT antagonist protein RsbS